jgi:hypothetical protein
MKNFISMLRNVAAIQIFTVYLRYLIGGAFVIAAFGMGKVQGKVDLLQAGAQSIETLQPIQQFFRVMMESGLYWQFIGWSQIAAGALLMTQRFARIGALIFFGLILNIFIITVSYDFVGTPVITGLMLLATIYLLLWDYESFIPLFRRSFHYEHQRHRIADDSYWTAVGVIMLSSIVLLAVFKQNFFWHLGVPLVVGFVAFVLYWFLPKKQRADQAQR